MSDDLPFVYDVEVVGLLAAPVHRYDGRPGDTVPEQSADRRERLDVRAGVGIVGDRYAGKPAHRNASVTVLAVEPVEFLAAELWSGPLDPLLARRNVVLRDAEVEALRGEVFFVDCGEGVVLLRGPARRSARCRRAGPRCTATRRSLRGAARDGAVDRRICTMRIPRLTAVIAATLLLAACGGSPLEGTTADEIVTAAADALEDAGSARVSGAVDQDGQEGEVDLYLQGEDATGTISLGGAEVEIRTVDGASYLKASPEFWASFGMAGGMSSLVDDQWVVLPGEAAGQFGDVTLAGIVEELRNPESPLEEVRADELDGEDVVIVEQEDGSTLTVADDEKPYPLRMTGDDTPDGITFSRFGEKEDIAAPDDALDLEDLLGGA